MSAADTPTTDDRYLKAQWPKAEWLRTIAFLDPDPASENRLPIHVAQATLINGEKDPAKTFTIARHIPVRVTADFTKNATIVTLGLLTREIEWKRHDADAVADAVVAVYPYGVGSLRVLTPAVTEYDDTYAWAVDAADGTWTLAHLYVESVEFSAGDPLRRLGGEGLTG